MTPARFNRLRVAAQNGDPAAKQELDMQSRKHREAIAASLDLIEIAKAVVIDGLAESNDSLREILRAKIQHQLIELDIDQCQNALERLLCEVCAVTSMNAIKNQMLCLQETGNQGTAKFRLAIAASSNRQQAIAAKSLADYRRKQGRGKTRRVQYLSER